MNDGDRVDDVLAMDREAIQLESRRLAAVYALVLEARDTVGRQFAERSVCEELRLARRVNHGECVSVVELAVQLHERFPQLLACLHDGLLDQYRARQACEVLRPLTREQAHTVAARIAERLRTGERPFEWRGYLRRVADATAPEAKQQRTTAARRDRWVRFDPGPDGAGTLLAQLPNEVLAACGNRIETVARSLRAHGDHRNLEQLRADTLTELLTGADNGSTEHTGDRVQASSPNTVRAVINVHMALGTALHIDQHEATIDGYGPIPASTARELLNNPDNAIRKVLTDPDTGRVVGLGRRRYRPSTRQRDYIHTRDRHCRTPGCTRPIAEIDHAQSWHQHGDTDPANLQGLCRLHHTLKTLPGWHHRLHPTTAELTLTTPTGRTYHGTPDKTSSPETNSPDPPPF